MPLRPSNRIGRRGRRRTPEAEPVAAPPARRPGLQTAAKSDEDKKHEGGRRRRPQPERTGPRRSNDGWLRPDEPVAAPAAPSHRAPAQPESQRPFVDGGRRRSQADEPATPVERALGDAYTVFDEFLEEGRRYAEGQSAWYSQQTGAPAALGDLVRGGADLLGLIGRASRELERLFQTLGLPTVPIPPDPTAAFPGRDVLRPFHPQQHPQYGERHAPAGNVPPTGPQQDAWSPLDLVGEHAQDESAPPQSPSPSARAVLEQPAPKRRHREKPRARQQAPPPHHEPPQPALQQRAPQQRAPQQRAPQQRAPQQRAPRQKGPPDLSQLAKDLTPPTPEEPRFKTRQR